MPAAQYVDVTANGGMVIDDRHADSAAIANVDALADANLGMRQRRAKAHAAIAGELCQAHAIVAAPQQDARQARNKAK